MNVNCVCIFCAELVEQEHGDHQSRPRAAAAAAGGVNLSSRYDAVTIVMPVSYDDSYHVFEVRIDDIYHGRGVR